MQIRADEWCKSYPWGSDFNRSEVTSTACMWPQNVHSSVFNFSDDKTSSDARTQHVFYVFLNSSDSCDSDHLFSRKVRSVQTSAPYSIFIFHSFTINFSKCNSPQWARASTLSRLHDHTQTHHTRYLSYGPVTSLMQRPLPHKHTIHKWDRHPWPPWDSNPQSHQASGNRPVC